MNILADQQIPFAKQAFLQFGDVELIHGREITRNHLNDVDILLVRSITKVNEALLEGTPVKFVGTATSGFDHVDQEYLQSQQIEFAYAPGSNARSVAEYILSALFVLFADNLDTLQNSTVGIIGYGHVGSKVARFIEALGVECLINDPPLAREQAGSLFVSLEEVLATDIITLHVPLTIDGRDPTYNLITSKQLEVIKNDAVLINTARGGVVDETALLNKMNNSSIKTVIDVWEKEPYINQALLKRADITTSHIAGYSTDGKLRATEMLLHSACKFFDELPAWSVSSFNAKANNAIHFSETSLSEIEMIGQLITESYNIIDDHKILQSAMNFSQDEIGAYFDKQRKEYRERLEFIHSAYSCSEPLDNDFAMFDKLGFKRELKA